MQAYVCTLVGKAAKFRGRSKQWWVTQTLYWKAVAINRHSKAYQDLLDRAYDALGQNPSFQKALLATGNATITHSLGKSDPSETILTRKEFISRLVKLREHLQSASQGKAKKG